VTSRAAPTLRALALLLGATIAAGGRATAALRARGPIALALFVGDNLYECGPDAVRPGAEACDFGPDGNTVATPPTGPEAAGQL
jgi:hypothetical protein